MCVEIRVIHYKRGSAGQFLLCVDLIACIREKWVRIELIFLKKVNEKYRGDLNAKGIGRERRFSA